MSLPEPGPKLVMLANGGDPESIPGAVMEVKYDGHRMLAYITAEGVRMYARTGAEKTGKLPAVEAWLRRLPVGTILDGEVIDPSKPGGDWSGVQTILGASSKTSTTLQYVVFDVLAVMGEDTRGYTWAARREMVEAIFAVSEDSEHVTMSEVAVYSAEEVDKLIASGHEGVIVKDPNGRYRSGKRDWIKVKATETVDVVVMGATEGKGRFAGQIGALIFGEYVDDMPDTAGPYLVERGQCSGMTDLERATFTAMRNIGELEGKVIEVRHMGRMPSGGWRHPQFLRVRTDKRAEECVA